MVSWGKVDSRSVDGSSQRGNVVAGDEVRRFVRVRLHGSFRDFESDLFNLKLNGLSAFWLMALHVTAFGGIEKAVDDLEDILSLMVEYNPVKVVAGGLTTLKGLLSTGDGSSSQFIIALTRDLDDMVIPSSVREARSYFELERLPYRVSLSRIQACTKHHFRDGAYTVFELTDTAVQNTANYNTLFSY